MQLLLPGFKEEYICPFCGQPATLFGQYSPHLPWGICRECSIKYPYPDVFVPSTRRNRDINPYMIDPSPEKADLRERRVELDEMLRCAVDPSRLERPIVKYNLSGLEIRNPIRRSRMKQFNTWSKQAAVANRVHQMQLPVCYRCGQVHDHRMAFDGLITSGDFHSRCQRCADEESVESLWKNRGIFEQDDAEAILDRLHKAFPDLFDRGVLPDYWFKLAEAVALNQPS